MVYCWCGNPTIVQTSRIAKNPRRNYYYCPLEGTKCEFNEWVDEEICRRFSHMIPRLLNAKNVAEERLKANRIKSSRLKRILIVSWIGFALDVWNMYV
ncbi:hypothetical protein QVD17_19755 [Tagetes erecta]|uniref:GRF-type domain-containing protein n=1 Tax=Tagetes erecta TaxID=13708 RepID=A0AAD8NXL0_TARER|nr:hypothetical protein QVD17_19755 [Tagetes erecta]